jgi:hypothetical protein
MGRRDASILAASCHCHAAPGPECLHPGQQLLTNDHIYVHKHCSHGLETCCSSRAAAKRQAVRVTWSAGRQEDDWLVRGPWNMHVRLRLLFLDPALSHVSSAAANISMQGVDDARSMSLAAAASAQSQILLCCMVYPNLSMSCRFLDVAWTLQRGLTT